MGQKRLAVGVALATVGAAAGERYDATRIPVFEAALAGVTDGQLEAAAALIVSRWRWRHLPTPADFLAAVAELFPPRTGTLPSADAWEIALGAVNRFHINGRTAGLAWLGKYHPQVCAAVRETGWQLICESKPSEPWARKAFDAAYRAACESEERFAALPPEVRSLAESVAGALPGVQSPKRVAGVVPAIQ